MILRTHLCINVAVAVAVAVTVAVTLTVAVHSTLETEMANKKSPTGLVNTII